MPEIPKRLGSITDLKEREAKAQSNNDQWEDVLNDAYEYCLPNRNLFDRQDQGQKKMDRIFDSTAIKGIQDGASKLQENIAPIWRSWMKLEPSASIKRLEEYEQREQEIRENLEEQTEIVFDHINNSNFSSQFNEAALDLLIGTATLNVSEDFDGDSAATFAAIPQFKIAFEEGPNGTIETHWRRRKVKARLLEREYQGFEPSQAVQETIRKSPEDKIEIVEGVVFEPKVKEYHGLVWVDGEERLSWVESYEDSSPWVTSRYFKVSGEVRGRGPALFALPDIKSLNKIKEFTLQKSAIDLAGIYTGVDDGQTNPYNMVISPGVVIPVASNNSQNPSLLRLDTNQRLDLALFSVEDLKNSVKEAFFGDLRDPNSPVRSATEIAIEARELAKKMGSAFGRLQSELLIPIINRVLWILKRRGLIQPLKIDGVEITAKFTSPLARAQDMEDLLAVQQAYEFTLMTAGQEAAQISFKVEDFGEYAAQKVGASQKLVRSEEEKQQFTKAAAQAQMMGVDDGVGQAQPRQQ